MTPEIALKGRGLARAIGSEQCHDLAGRDLDLDAFEDSERAIPRFDCVKP